MSLPNVYYRAGSGEPLLLLHPFALCGDVWKPVLPALERRHEVFVVTFPGHMGGDALPSDFRYDIATSVERAAAEMHRAGVDKAHVVGNSLGGWLAIELARRGRALSVVAIAPAGGWEPGSAEQRRVVRHFTSMRRQLVVGGPLAAVIARTELGRRAALGRVVARPEKLAPRDAAMLIRAAWRCAVYRHVLAAIPQEPAPEPLPRSPCPMRLVWGTHDRILPPDRYSGRWRRVLPDADWVQIERAGHVPMYDEPEAVARAILEVTARPARRASAGVR